MHLRASRRDSAMVASNYLTVVEVGRRLSASKDRVLGWISRKELRAINSSVNTNSKRPRWLISEADLEEFLAKRATMPATTAKPKKKITLSVPNYFNKE